MSQTQTQTQTQTREQLCGLYARIRRRVDTARRQLVADEKELERLKERIHDVVTLSGPVACDHMVFLLDPADRTLMAVSYRYAADLDHPDGPDLSDPLGVIEATKERLFRDNWPVGPPDLIGSHVAARDCRLVQPKPVIEPDLGDVLDESAHVVEVGHRLTAPRLIGRDV